MRWVIVTCLVVACSSGSGSDGSPKDGGGNSGGLAGNSGAGGGGGAGGTPLCVPGLQQSCACLGGVQGYQVCNTNGTAWEPCVCPDGGGGAAGTGGTPDAGGTAGNDAGPDSNADAGPDAAEKLAGVTGTPGGLALGSTHLAWTTEAGGGGSVHACTLASCASTANQLASGGLPHDVRIGPGGFVYWSVNSANNGGVYRCAMDSAGCAPLGLTLGQTAAGLELPLSSPFVWGTGTQVNKCVNHCASGITVLDPSSGAQVIRSDDTDLYWFAAGVGLRRCAIVGCGQAPTTLTPGFTSTRSVAVGLNHLSWRTASSIHVCPKAGCSGSVVSLASNQDDPGFTGSSLALDGTHAYWTNRLAGTVVRCALSGCGGAATVLASGHPQAAGVAVSPTHVFWISGTGVWSMPK